MRVRPYIAVEVDPVTAKAFPAQPPLLKENSMDAKFNWLIDNGAIRVTLNTVALALWIAMAVGLLELAARV